MVDIEAALRYPLEDDDWVTTVGIGGGLLLANGVITFFGTIIALLLSIVLVGFLLFPLIAVVSFAISLPVLGYGIRVLRSTIDGESTPPRFEDWGALFKDGLYGIVIGLVYAIPLIVISIVLTMVVVFVAVLAGGASSYAGGEALAAGGSLLFVFGQLAFFGVVTVYSLAMVYVVPISLAIYADEDSLRAAFSFARLKRVGLDGDFVVPWLVAAVGALIVNQVAGLLAVLLVGFFIQFYVLVVASRLIGQGYAAAIDADGNEADPSEAETPSDDEFDADEDFGSPEYDAGSAAGSDTDEETPSE